MVSCPRNQLYFLNIINELILGALAGGLVALRRQRQNTRQVAFEVDGEAHPGIVTSSGDARASAVARDCSRDADSGVEG